MLHAPVVRLKPHTSLDGTHGIILNISLKEVAQEHQEEVHDHHLTRYKGEQGERTRKRISREDSAIIG